MKKLLLTLFSALALSAGAQELTEIKNCPPEFYNKVDSLITTSIKDKIDQDWKISRMRIDSLKHSILGDRRFTSILSSSSELLYGDPNSRSMDHVYLVTQLGYDKKLFNELQKQKQKIQAWERSIPRGLNGFLVICQIYNEGKEFRYIFGIDKNVKNILWLSTPEAFRDWLSAAELMNTKKFLRLTTEPYTSNSFKRIIYGPLILHKESKFNIDNIVDNEVLHTIHGR